MDWLTMQRWSPYVAGIGIGLLGSLVFVLADRYIGCSAALSRTSGMIEKLFRRRKVDENPYYQKLPPVIDWEWLMVLGVIAGAFLSAVISGSFELRWVPPRWAATFGTSSVLRVVVAVVGGVFMGFGDVTIPQLLGVNPWVVVVPVAGIIVGLLIWIEHTWP